MTQQIRDTKQLNILVQEQLMAALKEMQKKGITPLIVETLRSKERQYYLYGQGRTVSQCIGAGMPKTYAQQFARSGGQVTWTLNSIHILGCAVDVIPQRKINGKMTAIWNSNDFQTLQIIEIMKKYGFEAGANWKQSPDSPHFQVANVSANGKYYRKGRTNYYVTKTIQQALKNAGYYNGYVVDGIWGVATTNAVKKFKKDNGWKANGYVGRKCLAKLLKKL